MSDVKFRSNFSKRFMWGVSTSAHQIEGGSHNQWTVWELENAKARSVQAEYCYGDLNNWNDIKYQTKDPSNYVSGELAEHRKFYKQDLIFLKKMNMNSYRFSIEWSRVEPKEGVYDENEINYYKEYIKTMEDMGIEPIITLFHFSLPIWFADRGGFEKRSNVKYFVRFSKKIIKDLGVGVKYIITINEPEMYAHMSYVDMEWPPMKNNYLLFFRVLNNLIYAHKKVYQAISATNRRYKISFSKNSQYFYPGDNSLISQISASLMQFFYDDYVIGRSVKYCDFLGVNYYNSNRVLGYRIHNPNKQTNDLGWDMHPADIQFVLERLHRKYNKPILITENGLADSKDEKRQWWIKETLVGIQNAMKYGVQIMGYLHWSLIDNFEWSHGKWPRFGLIEIDYKTKARKIRNSAVWFGRIIKKLRNV